MPAFRSGQDWSCTLPALNIPYIAEQKKLYSPHCKRYTNSIGIMKCSFTR